MAIDKTTGKGCAWSIASKMIAKKLVADGIVGKPIVEKTYKNRYELLWVYINREGEVCVSSERNNGSKENPLWVPSFIDIEKWEQGVKKFRAYTSLERNIEYYLLPEIEEYLRNIPDIELVSITRDFLIEHGVLNTPIRQCAGKTYYFNTDEVYSIDKEEKLFTYEGRLKFHLFKIFGETCFNLAVWGKAATHFKIGMTLEECINIFLKTELIHSDPRTLSPVDQLVLYICTPIYERVPENRDEATFDRIRIIVGLPRYKFDSWDTLRNEVKKYKNEIYKRVVQKLEGDRQLKKYGVPINFLVLSNVTLLPDYSMEFIFELKELKTDNH